MSVIKWIAQAPSRAKLEIDRKAIEKGGLTTFVRLAWPVLEPGAAYVHGWHIDAMADHLMACSNGQITRLLINVPPGFMKSLMAGVFWPAYEWGPMGRAHLRILATAHSERLAVRDNVKARRLITSPWFQGLYGDKVQIVRDQNAKLKFETTRLGFREAMPFTSLTGSRGDRVVLDDPLSVDHANSETEREKIITTFREALPTRLNNAERSVIVVIMQRLHERDVSGFILSEKYGYEHLMIPMEYEAGRSKTTIIGWKDPRTIDGELAFPQRFPRATVERDKKMMGSYAVAGQYQQRPAPREGGLFKRAYFNVVRAVPANARRVRAWDFAGTEKKAGAGDPDYTATVKLAIDNDGILYVEHVDRFRESPLKVEQALIRYANQDGKRCRISIPQDPGAAGKAQAHYLIRQLAGFIVTASPETGDKYTRAEAASAQAEAGNIVLIEGPWNTEFLDELTTFPSAAHDDMVDAFSRAFHFLVAPSGTGMLDYLRERAAEVEAAKKAEEEAQRANMA